MTVIGIIRATRDVVLAAKVAEAFAKNPKQMTPMMARELGVPEREVLRYLPEGRSRELDSTRVAELIQALEPLGKVFVIVNSGAVVLEAHGQFGGFSTTGPMLNVQTDSLDMHITTSRLTSTFAVRKAGHMDGVETLSFQFFTPEGNAGLKVFLTFGGKEATPERARQWEDLVTRFVLPPA